MSEIGQQVKNARRVSTPLVAINTHDPAATIKAVCAAIDSGNDAMEPAKVQWDFVRGCTGLNPRGEAWSKDHPGAENSCYAALLLAMQLEPGSILFIHQANLWLSEPGVIQAAWNLRDAFKADQRMVTFLAKCLILPAELSDDITTFEEPLPTETELAEIVARQHNNAEVKLDPAVQAKAVEALRGLSAFAAEQATALSLKSRAKGLDLNDCWERKRLQIEQTPGLKVFRGGETFEQIGGCDVIKQFVSRVVQGKARPNAVVFVDEIEKMLGGRGDTSGVSQDQLGAILTYMQDHNAAGMIFIGPPGAAKSAIAKAAGNEAGIPTVQLDLGACKGSLVGQSEQQLRAALKVVDAVSNGRSLWIATCNAIADLPPELRRRFTLGTFFFDLPSSAERSAIWDIYVSRLPQEALQQDIPNDDGWTGAEIRQCCDIAWRLGCTLQEAAEFVVPVSRSAADKLEALRSQADGRFLSASHPGVYQRKKANPTATGRQISLDE